MSMQRIKKVTVTLDSGEVVSYPCSGHIVETRTMQKVESWRSNDPREQHEPDVTEVPVIYYTVAFSPN